MFEQTMVSVDTKLSNGTSVRKEHELTQKLIYVKFNVYNLDLNTEIEIIDKMDMSKTRILSTKVNHKVYEEYKQKFDSIVIN